MTRAKDISKIVTDADLSGTLDVAGELQVGVDGTTAGLIRLMDSGSVTEEATISTDANGGLIFGGNSGPGELIFKTSSGTERVRITSAGNVGIGTTDPSSTLVVGGNATTTAKPTVAITDTTSGATLSMRGQSPKIAFDITSSGVPKILMDNAGLEFKTGTLDAEGDVDFKITSGGYLEATSGSQVRLTLGSEGTAGSNTANWIRGNGTSLGFNSAGGGYQWEIGGGEYMRIDSTGRVGIGTDSPSTLLMVEPSARTTNFSASDYTTYADILVKNPTDDSTCATGIAFITDATTYTNGASGIACVSGSGDSESSLAFITRPLNAVAAERMRIDSSGKLKVGTTNDVTINTPNSNIITNASFGINDGSNQCMLKIDRINFNSGNFFVLNESNVGVRLINGNTSWITQSDETLKENIVELNDVLSKVNDIRCVKYNLKSQTSDDVKIGFIAQDWQTEFNEVVSADDDNKLGMSYTETIPVLLKAIQELKAELDSAKARITALENGE
jgi:hypothetical protein